MGLEKKVLNVTGRDYEDIVLYLCAVISAAGEKLLIEDITKDHDFYYCIPHIEGIDPAEHILDYMGVGYVMEPEPIMNSDHTTNATPGIKAIEETNGKGKGTITGETINAESNSYTISIRLHDPDTFTPNGYPTLYVSDEKAYNLVQLTRLKADPGSILVIKDYTGAVKKKIDSLAEQLKCDRVYTLMPNIPDKKSETLATHSDRYKFNRISPQLRTLIQDLLDSLLPDVSQKDLKHAYKTASGGHIR